MTLDAALESRKALVQEVEGGGSVGTSNDNEYKRSQRGYGSRTRLKDKPSAKPLSRDYIRR
jgi:hypothetical protein